MSVQKHEMKSGGFVRLISEFSDVWHQIDGELYSFSNFITIAYEDERDGTRMVQRKDVADYRDDHPDPEESRIICYSGGTKFRRPDPYEDYDGFQHWKEHKDFEPFIQPFEQYP